MNPDTDAVSSASVIVDKPSGAYLVFINLERHTDAEALEIWRDFFAGKEIDLIITENNKLYPVEIKKATNPDKNSIKNFCSTNNKFPTFRTYISPIATCSHIVIIRHIYIKYQFLFFKYYTILIGKDTSILKYFYFKKLLFL